MLEMAKIHAMEELRIANAVDFTTPVIPIHAEKQIESNGKTDLGLADTLKPIFRTMSIFGMFHTPKRWQKSCISSETRWLNSLQKFYCVLIQVLLWLQAFRMIISVWVGDEPSLDPKWTVLEFICGLYFLQGAINCSLWFYICCTDQLPNIVNYWEEFCHNNIFNLPLDVSWIRRRKRILLGGGFFFVIYNIISLSACVYGPFESFRNDTIFLSAPLTTYGPAWKVPILVVASIFNSATFIFPINVFIIFCMIYSRQFETLTDTFTSFLTEDGKVTQCLLLFRRQHQYLCKSVQQTNQALSFYLASKSCITLCILCFGLFQLIIVKSIPSFLMIIILISWLVMITVSYALVAVFAVMVHEKVRVNGKYGTVFFILFP